MVDFNILLGNPSDTLYKRLWFQVPSISKEFKRVNVNILETQMQNNGEYSICYDFNTFYL
jgi:hypothetical protein